MTTHLQDDDLIHLIGASESVPDHVRECAECSARLRQFERTLELTAAPPPRMAWNSLQAGSFMHRVRRGIEQRHQPRVTPWWQPALAGAAMTLLVMLSFRAFVPASGPNIVQAPVAAEQEMSSSMMAPSHEEAVEESMTDDELLSMIDAYLIDTASEDELLTTLGDFSDDDMIAVLDLQ